MVVSAATAIALGTYIGGWRIIRTVGTRIIKMDAAQGFSAQGAGAAVILASTHFGFPLSTTQVISGGVMGAGAGKRLSAVRWGVAGNIVVAWILTFPAAALIGGATYGFTQIFGGGVTGTADRPGRRRRAGGVRVRTPDQAGIAGGRMSAGCLIATVVDTRALWETVVASLVAGVGVTLVFSIALLGAARFAEHRREGRTGRQPSSPRSPCSARPPSSR